MGRKRGGRAPASPGWNRKPPETVRQAPLLPARGSRGPGPALKARAARRRQAEAADFRRPAAPPPDGAARLRLEVRGGGKGALRSASGRRSALAARRGVAAAARGRLRGGGTSAESAPGPIAGGNRAAAPAGPALATEGSRGAVAGRAGSGAEGLWVAGEGPGRSELARRSHRAPFGGAERRGVNVRPRGSRGWGEITPAVSPRTDLCSPQVPASGLGEAGERPRGVRGALCECGRCRTSALRTS